MALIVFISIKIGVTASTWGGFFVSGLIMFVVSILLFLIVNYAFEGRKIKRHIEIVRSMLKGKEQS
jgi:hypothetical protein